MHFDMFSRYVMFNDEIPHFKSARCRQLDEELGDTFSKVAERQIEIVIHLSNFVLAR